MDVVISLDQVLSGRHRALNLVLLRSRFAVSPSFHAQPDGLQRLAARRRLLRRLPISKLAVYWGPFCHFWVGRNHGNDERRARSRSWLEEVLRGRLAVSSTCAPLKIQKLENFLDGFISPAPWPSTISIETFLWQDKQNRMWKRTMAGLSVQVWQVSHIKYPQVIKLYWFGKCTLKVYYLERGSESRSSCFGGKNCHIHRVVTTKSSN